MRVSISSPRWKTSPLALVAAFSVLAMACGTGGVADTPRSSSKTSHDAVEGPANNHITIDFPGARLTEVNDVNAGGEVVGRYILPDGISHGFLRDIAGGFTTIDFPGAIFTTPKGINRDGDIVGGYIAADGLIHGFLFSDGEFTQIDFSVTTATFPTGIDSGGDIVGGYCLRPCNPFDVNARRLHGFSLSHDKFVTFDVPGSTSTAFIHTSRGGGLVGLYKDAKDVPHGFVLRDGALTFIDVPRAVGTWALGINSSGDVVGSWCDANPCTLAQDNNHAFKLGQKGFEVFDFPGAATSRAWGINDGGDIAGAFRDPQGVNHGFILLNESEDANEAPGDQTISGSGNWSIQLSPTSTQTVAANVVINFTLREIISGAAAGVREGSGRLVMKPDGTFHVRDCGTFVGSIGPSSGTATMCVVARGAGTSIQGKVKITDGVGGLDGVRGFATFTGSATGPLAFAGTYSSEIRFPGEDSSR